MRAPDAVAPPPGHPRFPHVDAMRAIAAIAVLAAHAGNVAGINEQGWYGPLVAQGVAGVPIFFIISGFLLYRPFLAMQLDGLRPVQWRDYMRRRLLRIVPAYWLALTIIALWMPLPDVFTHNWWRYYFFAQVYWHNTAVDGLFIAWTLCMELSFYIMLPFYAWGMAWLGRGRSRIGRIHQELLVLAILGFGSIALRLIPSTAVLAPFYLTLRYSFTWFALGMALAVISIGDVVPRFVAFVARHPATCWLIAGATYVGLAFLLPLDVNDYTNDDLVIQYALSGVFAVLLVAPTALGASAGGWPRKVTSWRVLAWLGLISYGIYLWHILFVNKVVFGWMAAGDRPIWVPRFVYVFGLSLLLAVAFATASYYLLERPVMRFKNTRLWFTRRKPREAAVAPGPAAAEPPPAG